MKKIFLVIIISLISFQHLIAQKAAIISVKDDISEHAGDTALKEKLVSLGFEVVSYRDGDLDAGSIGEEEYKTNDLIVASESVSASKLRKILSYGFSVPTINMEPLSVGNSHHKLELISTVATGNGWLSKDDEDAYKIKILNGEHPIANGFNTGDVIELVSDPSCIDEDPWASGYIGWMVDEIGVIPIASINSSGGDTSLVISGIEVGTLNVHRDIFNARYVQFNVNSFTPTAWTAETETLFESAIDWVMEESTSVEIEENNSIREYNLSQNFPNPFNPNTIISYEIKKSVNVELKVYDLLGREVAVLVNKEQAAGSYNVQFDAENLISGVYFYLIRAGEYSESKKMVLLK